MMDSQGLMNNCAEILTPDYTDEVGGRPRLPAPRRASSFCNPHSSCRGLGGAAASRGEQGQPLASSFLVLVFPWLRV